MAVIINSYHSFWTDLNLSIYFGFTELNYTVRLNFMASYDASGCSSNNTPYVDQYIYVSFTNPYWTPQHVLFTNVVYMRVASLKLSTQLHFRPRSLYTITLFRPLWLTIEQQTTKRDTSCDVRYTARSSVDDLLGLQSTPMQSYKDGVRNEARVPLTDESCPLRQWV